ncbi:hypothetical protein V6N11_026498 [Hibiscus sabdariffa]|uniref:Uncharacterized protein n=1 Tax=Hibiscus sabdariffa TaxID=183260 RepID=A0ABR2SVW3_9ROSI
MPVSRTKQSYEKIPLFVKATHMSYKISLPSGHHQGFRLVHWLPEKWPSSGTVSAAHGNGRPITFDSPRLPHSSQIVDAGNTSLRGAIALSAAFEGIVLFLTVALHHIAFDRLGLFRTIIVTIPCLFLVRIADVMTFQFFSLWESQHCNILHSSGATMKPSNTVLDSRVSESGCCLLPVRR